MRVLVTGGSGFIGSYVVERLVAAGVEVRIFDLRKPSASPAGLEVVVGDLLDRAVLGAAMTGCDAVVHLAAAADADAVACHPAAAEEVNSRGTLNVLEAGRTARVKRVVYASTIWVYSDAGARVADEDTALGLPRHLYTATKLAGEMYCRSYAELYGLEYTILRFGIPYGPRARQSAVIPTFVRKALSGEPLAIAGGGGQSRRFVYVEDLAEGVVRALAPVAANRIYNLVGDRDVTIREVAETVQGAAGDATLVHVAGRSADFSGVEVSGERAARELGWRPSTPFATGVGRYVAWHRQHVERGGRRDAPERRPEPVGGRLPGRLDVPRWRAGRAALAFSVALVLAAPLIGVLHRVGATADDLRTVAGTMVLGLTLYLLLVPDAGSRRRARLASAGWLAGGLLVALLGWPHDALRLAHTDVELGALSAIGGTLGVFTGVAGRRLLGSALRERSFDSGG